MSRKYQQDLRRIAGIDGTQGGLDSQAPKSQISGRRGVAYYTSSGAVAKTGSETTDDVVSFPDGSGTDTNFKDATNQAPVATNPNNPLVLTPETAGNEPGSNTGKVLTRLEGLYDCTTGREINLNVGFDQCTPPVTKINCVDVCVDPQPDPTYVSGWTWQTSGFGYGADSWHYTKQQCFDYLCYQMISANIANGHLTEEQRDQVYCSHPQNNPTNFGVYPRWIATNDYLPNWDQYVNVRQLECSALSAANQSAAEPCYINDPTQAETCPAEIYTQQCEEHPWDTCECYHIEKRGTELKAGWDSAQMYKEAVNCAPDPTWNSGQYLQSTNINPVGTNSLIASAQAKVDAAMATLAADCPWPYKTSFCEFCNLGTVNFAALEGLHQYYGSPKIAVKWTFNQLSVPTKYVVNCHVYMFNPDHTVWSTSRNRWSTAFDEYRVFYAIVNATSVDIPENWTVIKDYGLTNKTGNGISYGNQWIFGYYKDCYSSTAWYCNPEPDDILACDVYEQICENYETDPTAEDCNPYPITQAEDCCPPQDATTPQGCMWTGDGALEYVWNPTTGKFEASALDPDVFDEQAPTAIDPNELNLCDQYGKATDIGTTSDGGLVITYDPTTNGGITYVVRGEDGKITAAGDVGRDAYLDPNNPLNWQ